jgi:hypothetical protein
MKQLELNFKKKSKGLKAIEKEIPIIFKEESPTDRFLRHMENINKARKKK